MLIQFALLGRSYCQLYLLTGQKHYLDKARLLMAKCVKCHEGTRTISMAA